MKDNNFQLRRLGTSDMDLIMDLQDAVISKLEYKDWLRNNSREMLEGCVQDPNLTYGVFSDDKLAAVGIIVDVAGTEEDLSLQLVKFSVNKPANLKSIIVRKEYRGNGLQQYLMRLLEEQFCRRGYTDLCASIHPDNKYSISNALALGYEFDHQQRKYGGLLRNIYVKKIEGKSERRSSR